MKTEDMRDHQIEVSVNRSAVGKIPRNAKKGAWAKFHQNWKREQMGARDLAVNVWKGYAFAPCFNGKKIKADFDCAWHLALDFDCGDERAKIENLLVDDLIDRFSSFLYYTPSSKAPAYKSRVVFIFDSPITTVDEYEELLNAFAWWFPNSDQSTTDAARFFYGSEKCELIGNWSILPLDSASEIIKIYRKENPTHKKEVKPFKPQSTDEKKVAEALRFIPKQMDYTDWLKVCMGVHSAFPNHTGVKLLEGWSPGYDGEIEDKFKSFERTSTDGVTIRTVYKMAVDHGWTPKVNKYKKRQSLGDRRQALMNADIGNGSSYRIRRS